MLKRENKTKSTDRNEKVVVLGILAIAIVIGAILIILMYRSLPIIIIPMYR